MFPIYFHPNRLSENMLETQKQTSYKINLKYPGIRKHFGSCIKKKKNRHTLFFPTQDFYTLSNNIVNILGNFLRIAFSFRTSCNLYGHIVFQNITTTQNRMAQHPDSIYTTLHQCHNRKFQANICQMWQLVFFKNTK